MEGVKEDGEVEQESPFVVVLMTCCNSGRARDRGSKDTGGNS